MSARLIMKLRVAAMVNTTADVVHVRLVHPTRPKLPPWSPGAHVDLHLPDGRVRQYSLCGDPSDTATYDIAVKREGAGRGGSLWIHDNLAQDAVAHVSAPRNNFPLAETAERHILVAGGIGITPILTMARWLAARDQDFSLHYCAKSQTEAPFLKELHDICGPRLRTWFSSAGQRFDPQVLGPPQDAVHVYGCGPVGLLEAMTAGALEAGWRAEQIHVEKFQSVLDENFVPEPFNVRLESTGEILAVPASSSLLDILLAKGLPIRSSCVAGICGSCVCGYRDGDVIHRDAVIQLSERGHRIAPCVSRGRGMLTLEF